MYELVYVTVRVVFFVAWVREYTRGFVRKAKLNIGPFTRA